jgi:hypothetical protein
MTTIELPNNKDWKVDWKTDEEVQNTYGYPFLHTYNFRGLDPDHPERGVEHMFHFRSMEELHPLQLERIVNCYIDGKNAGRRAETTAFQNQVHSLINASGLRPLLVAVLRDLMGPH